MQLRMLKRLSLLVCFLLLAMSSLLFFSRGQASGAHAAGKIHHYLYVFPDQGLYIYNIDNYFKPVKQIPLPMTNGGRGIMADPAGGFLYLSYNGDGGVHGNGSLLKYDLIHNKIVWMQNYPFGIDSGALTPDGKTICRMARHHMMERGTFSIPAMVVSKARSSP